MFFTEYAVNFTKKILAENSMIDILSDDLEFDNSLVKFIFSRYFIGVNAKMLNKTEQLKMGLSLDDILINCVFNAISCSSKDFEWYFDITYGNCYK
jgi:hypothetical protein